MLLKTMDKTVRNLQKTQFFVEACPDDFINFFTPTL